MKMQLPSLTQIIQLQRAYLLLVDYCNARACVCVQFEWRVPVFYLRTIDHCRNLWVACVHIFSASQWVFVPGARFQRPAVLKRQ